MTPYDHYQHLLFERADHGILKITINRPEVLNATNSRLHWELAHVWLDIADDPETNVVVITGAGRAFSAGGDLGGVEKRGKDFNAIAGVMREASDLVYNITNLDKPIVSAINGVAVGAGLAVALMADVSIISETARITDGHLRLGVAAGDHAVIIWPLLCGMAKAKYYLLTSDFLDALDEAGAQRLGAAGRLPLRPFAGAGDDVLLFRRRGGRGARHPGKTGAGVPLRHPLSGEAPNGRRWRAERHRVSGDGGPVGTEEAAPFEVEHVAGKAPLGQPEAMQRFPG